MSVEVEAAARRDPRIRYLGQIGALEKESFFRRIDALVVPSEWEEPAALVSTEAIARSIPAVVSNRGGLPDTPEGIVFSAGDPLALREALDRLGADAAFYASVSRRLFERRDEFSWETHQRNIEAVYAAAIEEEAVA